MNKTGFSTKTSKGQPLKSDSDLELIHQAKMSRREVNQGRSALLTAVGHQTVVAILSPRLPVRFLSDSINTIQNFGFQIESIKRQSFNEKQLKGLDDGKYPSFTLI